MERFACATGAKMESDGIVTVRRMRATVSQARLESSLRYERACQIPPFILIHLIELLHDLTLNFYS